MFYNIYKCVPNWLLPKPAAMDILPVVPLGLDLIDQKVCDLLALPGK